MQWMLTLNNATLITVAATATAAATPLPRRPPLCLLLAVELVLVIGAMTLLFAQLMSKV